MANYKKIYTASAISGMDRDEDIQRTLKLLEKHATDMSDACLIECLEALQKLQFRRKEFMLKELKKKNESAWKEAQRALFDDDAFVFEPLGVDK